VTDQPAHTNVGDVVEIKVPADSSYISLVRTATAALAARADFTVDEIDDLRIAVDEACALLLPDARPGTELVCRFTLTAAALRITVSAQTDKAVAPAPTSFAWMVLTALAGDVAVHTDGDDGLTIGLSKIRSSTR
jgi:serine/threonine-protein kinase RsbW